jgi:hypothetical protein
MRARRAFDLLRPPPSRSSRAWSAGGGAQRRRRVRASRTSARPSSITTGHSRRGGHVSKVGMPPEQDLLDR